MLEPLLWFWPIVPVALDCLLQTVAVFLDMLLVHAVFFRPIDRNVDVPLQNSSHHGLSPMSAHNELLQGHLLSFKSFVDSPTVLLVPNRLVHLKDEQVFRKMPLVFLVSSDLQSLDRSIDFSLVWLALVLSHMFEQQVQLPFVELEW